MKKVVVIGLDGFEPKILESMQEKGELPHLSRLRSQGGYTRIGTTYPAQTPVAWSTFATGTNPGGHGIFDFLSRDPQTYLPLLGLSRYEQKNAFTPPRVVNMRRGTPFWNLLAEAGVPSTILRLPCTYPPDEINGRMLSGVGVPDLRGGLGTSTFFTSEANVSAEHSEKVVQVQHSGTGVIETHLVGPRNPRTRADFLSEITIHLKPSEKKITVLSSGEPRELEVKEGEWSDWLKVKFKVGLLQTVRGIARLYLSRIEPIFELYASPINFDPDAPLFPISAPPEYARELEARLGTFYTTGMAEDHDGLNNGRFDEMAYLAQCSDVMREREKMMLYELERMREGFFFCLFDTPDRLQHMFWRFHEPDHPANQEPAGPEMTHVIHEHYRACDEVVGKALECADDETLFMVLSDHGMNSFQRGIHLNSWLYENGFLSLKRGVGRGDEAGDFFHGVDWSSTKAYALGLGGIYLNMKGREAQGIVSADEAGRIKSAITSRLTGIKDREKGHVAVRSVLGREQIYRGPYVAEAPDLLVNFTEGYRVSWETPLGGVPAGLFDDNRKKWGGDHVIDPALAPGILLMNQPFRKSGVNLVDIAPTILSAFGVDPIPSMEGRSLTQ